MGNVRIRRYISKILYKRLFFKYRKYIGRQIETSNKSNKIVLISHDSSDSGAVVLLLEMVKEFHRLNFEILVLTKNYGPLIRKASDYACVNVFHSISRFEKIIKKAYKSKYRNVICNTVVTGDLVPILKMNLFSVITLVHELPNTIHLLEVENNALSLAQYSDTVIFPSNYVLDKFPFKKYVTDKSLIRPQGLNFVPDITISKRDAKIRLEELFEIPEVNTIILCVGVGNERKGFDIFLDLARMCKCGDISFVWVGDYSKQIYESKLKYYNTKSIDNLFKVGFVEDKETLSYFYSASDIFALTSREDPFPSVVLQAFNVGLPVIAFRDAGGFSDIVIDGVTGYLVEYENVLEMFAKLVSLYENPLKIISLGESAKDKIKNYSFTEYIHFLVNLFEEFT